MNKEQLNDSFCAPKTFMCTVHRRFSPSCIWDFGAKFEVDTSSASLRNLIAAVRLVIESFLAHYRRGI